MKAYHFLCNGLFAGCGDETAWTVGEERTLKGSLELCSRGYHSSPSWFDALKYAPGPVACIVKISAPEEIDTDKQVSRTRRLIAARDASRELRLFAADCAERALNREREAGREPDPCSWTAIEVARKYANGFCDSGELDAAYAACAACAAYTTCAARDAACAACAASAAYAARAASAACAARTAYAAYEEEGAWQRERLALYLDTLLEQQK